MNSKIVIIGLLIYCVIGAVDKEEVAERVEEGRKKVEERSKEEQDKKEEQEVNKVEETEFVKSIEEYEKEKKELRNKIDEINKKENELIEKELNKRNSNSITFISKTPIFDLFNDFDIFPRIPRIRNRFGLLDMLF